MKKIIILAAVDFIIFIISGFDSLNRIWLAILFVLPLAGVLWQHN